MVFGRRGGQQDSDALLTVRDPVRGTLDVGADQTVVMLGASGAGKSTLMKSVVGIGQHFDDEQLLGQPFSRELLAETVGWVPQGDGVFLSETVWQNVHAPKYVAACEPEWAADALDWVGLSDRTAEPVTNLGLSARRRVALARAVARRRPLLVIDGELDRSLWPMFPALCQQFSWLHGVLVATASVEDLAWKADAVVLVEEGRMITQAPLADLIDSRDPSVRSVLAWTTP